MTITISTNAAALANTTLATRAIHAGQEPDPTTGAVITPIYMTSTFKQDGVGGLRNGYDYSRSVNPTRNSFDAQLAAVEGAKYALSFSSGLAAIDVLLRATLKPGDNILLGNDVYGGTYRLLAKVFVPWGIGLDVVDITDTAAVAAALEAKQYRYIWVETPSNPLLNITDIAATADVAHRHGTKVVVDNTFASPVLQHPLDDGADAVVYSTTKYIGGHSECRSAARSCATTAEPATRSRPAERRRRGASPFDSWLGHPRPEDPGRASAAPQRKRAEDRAMAGNPSGSGARVVPGTGIPPGVTRLPPVRCTAVSAAWFPCSSRPVSRRPSGSPAPRRSSRSPSHWAEWRA